MLTRLLRLLFVRPAEPPVDRERWNLARGLDSLVKDAKPRRTLLWVVPPIIHPDVARACLPSARDLAAALRDPDADVDPAVVAGRALVPHRRPLLAALRLRAAGRRARARGSRAPCRRARRRLRLATAEAGLGEVAVQLAAPLGRRARPVASPPRGRPRACRRAHGAAARAPRGRTAPSGTPRRARLAARERARRRRRAATPASSEHPQQPRDHSCVARAALGPTRAEARTSRRRPTRDASATLPMGTSTTRPDAAHRAIGGLHAVGGRDEDAVDVLELLVDVVDGRRRPWR